MVQKKIIDNDALEDIVEQWINGLGIPLQEGPVGASQIKGLAFMVRAIMETSVIKDDYVLPPMVLVPARLEDVEEGRAEEDVHDPSEARSDTPEKDDTCEVCCGTGEVMRKHPIQRGIVIAQTCWACGGDGRPESRDKYSGV